MLVYQRVGSTVGIEPQRIQPGTVDDFELQGVKDFEAAKSHFLRQLIQFSCGLNNSKPSPTPFLWVVFEPSNMWWFMTYYSVIRSTSQPP